MFPVPDPPSMSPELSTLLALAAGGLALLAGGVYWWVNRTPTVERRENEPLPLFGAMTPDERQSSVRPTPPSAPAVAATPVAPTSPRPVAPPAAAPPVAAPMPAAAPRAPVIREFTTATSATAPQKPAVPPPPAPAPVGQAPPADHAIVSAAGVPGTMVEGHTLRFSVPAEGTLQFLPGRLEIGSGLDAGREIRLVRVEGPNGIEVTFGRSEGELYKHIQLRDKTVSRAHAIMRFQNGVWLLQNLSLTNPVVHNGAQMPAEVAQPLADGDRVEMGEVLFTFRSR